MPIFEEQNYLQDFFTMTQKMLVKYPHFLSIKRNITVAINTLVFNCKEMLNYLHDFMTVSLITGYLDNLFEIYFNLAQTPYEDWDKKLSRYDYLELTIVSNLDFFFEKTKIQKLCLDNELLCQSFEKLYSTILTVILKTEFLTDYTTKIFKVIVDCFAITFMFSKSKTFLKLSSKVWDMVGNKVNMQSIMIRFVSALENIPIEVATDEDIFSILNMSFYFIKRHYGNPMIYDANIHFFNKATLQKIFMWVHTSINGDGFHDENDQAFIIEMILNWTSIFKEYLGVVIKSIGD